MKSKKYILLLSLLMLIASVGFSLTITSTLPNGSSDKDIPVEANKEYELNFDLDKQNTNTIRLVISEGTTILVDAPNLSAGSNSFAFTASSSTVNIKFQRLDTDNQTKTFAVNNLSYTPHESTQNHTIGLKEYEITDHLGNVRVVLSDKLNSGQAEVESATDYLPFGMVASGRTFSNGYRYGFNGKEKDDAFQDTYNYGERIFNTQLGIWLSIDGAYRIYPAHSPYNFTLSNPIGHKELDGDVVETGWDCFNVALDLASLASNIASGNYLDATVDGAGLLYDGIATIVPGLPGGAGAGIKAYRSEKVVVKVVNKVDKPVLSYAERMAKMAKWNYSKESSGLWSKLNYRANLQKYSGKLADGFDAHHTFPKNKELSSFFEKAGIDVNDPANLVWRDQKSHRGSNSAEHMKLWMQFAKDHPKADKKDILKFRETVEKKIWGNATGDTPLK